MTPHQFQVEPDLNALLTTGKEIDPVSDIVRARALSPEAGGASLALTPGFNGGRKKEITR